MCIALLLLRKAKGKAKEQMLMQLFYVCDYCREVYQSQEAEGPEGAIEIIGVCLDCLEELGLVDDASFAGLIHQFH